ncbi:MAG: hypothetical protein ABI670_17120 [Chloroflexota bacterium]
MKKDGQTLEKERSRVTGLLMAMVILAMMILVINRLNLPAVVLVLAVILLIVLGVVTGIQVLRMRRQRK